MRLGLGLGITFPRSAQGGAAPAGTLTSISPSSKHQSDPAFTLTATGTNFTISSVIQLDGSGIATSYVSATSLTATVTPSSLATGTRLVTVVDGATTTASQALSIDHASPTLSGISPSSATVGASNTTVTCTGTGFDPSTVIYAGALALTTTYVSATQVTAVMPSTALTTAGTSTFTAVAPTPGGGTSSGQSFTINNPATTSSSLATSSYTRWNGAQTGTINGTGFLSGVSVVSIDGTPVTTTFVSSTQLQFAIANSLLWETGSHSVTVTNPGPGGGTSGAQTFSVTQPSYLHAEYRASAGRTMNGSTVQVLADQSGKGDSARNLSQLTTGAQPTYNATDSNFNNQATLSYTASQYMQSGTWTSPPTQPVRDYLVAKNGTSATSFLIDGIASANRHAFFRNSGTANLAVSSGAAITTSLWDALSKQVVAYDFNGASSQLWVSTKTAGATSLSSGVQALTGITHNAQYNATSNATMTLAHHLVIASTGLTTAQHNEIMTYLGSRYNVTIGN